MMPRMSSIQKNTQPVLIRRLYQLRLTHQQMLNLLHESVPRRRKKPRRPRQSIPALNRRV